MRIYFKEIVPEEASSSTAALKTATRQVNAKQPRSREAFLKPQWQTSHPRILDTWCLWKGCARNRLGKGWLGARGHARMLSPLLVA